MKPQEIKNYTEPLKELRESIDFIIPIVLTLDDNTSSEGKEISSLYINTIIKILKRVLKCI